MKSIELVTEEVREFGVVSIDRAGETVRVQTDPDEWSTIEDVAERHDWQVCGRSKPRHQLTLKPADG